MAGQRERGRTKRREDERAARKLVRERDKLAAALPGGAPEHPLAVASAAVIETMARANTCVQCGSTLDLRGDRAQSTARGVLRALDLVCRVCHAPRTLWYLIVGSAPS